MLFYFPFHCRTWRGKKKIIKRMRLMVYTRQITNDEYTLFSFISNERLTMYWEYSRLYQSIRKKISLFIHQHITYKIYKRNKYLTTLVSTFRFYLSTCRNVNYLRAFIENRTNKNVSIRNFKIFIDHSPTSNIWVPHLQSIKSII